MARVRLEGAGAAHSRAHLRAGACRELITNKPQPANLRPLLRRGSSALLIAQLRLDYAVGAAPRHLRTASPIETSRLRNLQLPDAGQGQRSSRLVSHR